MLIPEVIRSVMKITNTTQKRLADMCGNKSQGSIGMALNSKIMANTMLKWFDKMGYEVIVQPKTSGKRRAGSFVLEPDMTVTTGREKNGSWRSEKSHTESEE